MALAIWEQKTNLQTMNIVIYKNIIITHKFPKSKTAIDAIKQKCIF